MSRASEAAIRAREAAKRPKPPEVPGYWCNRCERRHLPGSLIYERHREEP